MTVPIVIGQSRRIGTMAQRASPVRVWLEEVLGSTSRAQKRTERLFERLLRADLLELAGRSEAPQSHRCQAVKPGNRLRCTGSDYRTASPAKLITFTTLILRGHVGGSA
jgi:hypothetical protein